MVAATATCSIYVTNSRTEPAPRQYGGELHEALNVSDYAEIAPQTPGERKQAQARRLAHMEVHAEAQARGGACGFV